MNFKIRIQHSIGIAIFYNSMHRSIIGTFLVLRSISDVTSMHLYQHSVYKFQDSNSTLHLPRSNSMHRSTINLNALSSKIYLQSVPLITFGIISRFEFYRSYILGFFLTL